MMRLIDDGSHPRTSSTTQGIYCPTHYGDPQTVTNLFYNGGSITVRPLCLWKQYWYNYLVLQDIFTTDGGVTWRSIMHIHRIHRTSLVQTDGFRKSGSAVRFPTNAVDWTFDAGAHELGARSIWKQQVCCNINKQAPPHT